MANALIISIARLNNDPNYKAYSQGRKILLAVDHLLETTGIKLANSGDIPELIKFQEHFKELRIVVFGGLNCDDIVFDAHVESEKRINLLYGDGSRHYQMICNLTGTMTQVVIKGAKGSSGIGVKRRAVTVCQFRNFHTPMSKSRVSHVIDSLGVAHVLKNTRQTSWEESLYVNRSETVPYVIYV
jgi:hypothetical protein